jgi:hypothetical protein
MLNLLQHVRVESFVNRAEEGIRKLGNDKGVKSHSLCIQSMGDGIADEGGLGC